MDNPSQTNIQLVELMFHLEESQLILCLHLTLGKMRPSLNSCLLRRGDLRICETHPHNQGENSHDHVRNLVHTENNYCGLLFPSLIFLFQYLSDFNCGLLYLLLN